MEEEENNYALEKKFFNFAGLVHDSVAESLPSKCKALSSSPRTTKISFFFFLLLIYLGRNLRNMNGNKH
jgi:hypothetical protein